MVRLHPLHLGLPQTRVKKAALGHHQSSECCSYGGKISQYVPSVGVSSAPHAVAADPDEDKVSLHLRRQAKAPLWSSDHHFQTLLQVLHLFLCSISTWHHQSQSRGSSLCWDCGWFGSYCPKVKTFINGRWRSSDTTETLTVSLHSYDSVLILYWTV